MNKELCEFIQAFICGFVTVVFFKVLAYILFDILGINKKR